MAIGNNKHAAAVTKTQTGPRSEQVETFAAHRARARIGKRKKPKKRRSYAS